MNDLEGETFKRFVRYLSDYEWSPLRIDVHRTSSPISFRLRRRASKADHFVEARHIVTEETIERLGRLFDGGRAVAYMDVSIEDYTVHERQAMIEWGEGYVN